jgi:hypothetical protein
LLSVPRVLQSVLQRRLKAHLEALHKTTASPGKKEHCSGE